MAQPFTATDTAGLEVASGPMSRDVAHWYQTHTGGQLQAHQHADGRWYLYTPVDTDTPPGTGPGASRQYAGRDNRPPASAGPPVRLLPERDAAVLL
jgi:hypothetical protein